MSEYDSLRFGTRHRLAQIRKRYPSVSADAIKSALRWRDDGYMYHDTQFGGIYSANSAALDHLRTAPDERPRHKQGIGWYCDAYHDNVASGHAVQLPTRNGESRFLAFVKFSGQDGAIIDASVHDSAPEAYRAADWLAERVAEQEREYAELNDAAHLLVEKNHGARAEMRAMRTRVSQLVSTIRELPATSENRARIVGEIGAIRADFRELLEQVNDRADELAALVKQGACV